jgi:hypothetical protein
MSDWGAIEALIVDLLDSLSDLDGEIDAHGLEQFSFALSNIIESRPRGVAELGYAVLREKLRLAMTSHFRHMAHSTFVKQVEKSQSAFERLVRLHCELAEGVRRQRLSTSLIAISRSGQAVTDSTPAKLNSAAKRRDKTMKTPSDGASEVGASEGLEIEGDAIPRFEMQEAAE